MSIKLQTINNAGLVGWWGFEENQGNVARDSSGNNNHGTLVNAPVWTDGKIGKGLKFDGTNRYVNLGNILNNLDNHDRSLSLWLYRNSDNLMAFLTKNGSVNAPWYFLVTGDALWRWTGLQSVIKIPKNQWCHIVYTFQSLGVDTGIETFFVNGSFSNSGNHAMPLWDNTTSMTIGSSAFFITVLLMKSASTIASFQLPKLWIYIFPLKNFRYFLF